MNKRHFEFIAMKLLTGASVLALAVTFNVMTIQPAIADDCLLDTNNDGNATVPAPGNWSGLGIGNGASPGTLRSSNMTIRYGVHGIFGNRGTLDLSDSTISNNSGFCFFTCLRTFASIICRLAGFK